MQIRLSKVLAHTFSVLVLGAMIFGGILICSPTDLNAFADGYVAKIGETEYESLSQAYNAAATGDTIEILSNIELSDCFEVGKSLTINGNGYKIENSATRIIRITKPDVELTINNWNLTSTCTVGSDERGISFDNKASGSKLTLNRCQLSAEYYAINAVLGADNLIIQVKDGSVAAGWAAFNLYSNNSTINVENSTLNGLNDKDENTWNNFNTITFDGNCLNGGTTGEHGSNNTLNIKNSTVYASSNSENKQHWIGIQYGAEKNTVKVDSQSKIIDSNGEDQTDNLLLGWYYNYHDYNWSYYENKSTIEVELGNNDTLYAVGGDAEETLSDNSKIYFDLVYHNYYSSGSLDKESYNKYVYRILMPAKLIEGFTEPSGKEGLIYSGQEQELITAGTVPEGTNGSFMYALGNDATAAPTSGWTTSVPKGADAGTYYVWYKIVNDSEGDKTHPECVTVKISEKPETKPTAATPILTAKGIVKNKTTAKISWNKVEGAVSYEVYLNKCNAKGKKYSLKLRKKTSGSSIKVKKLKKSTCYKFYVAAKDANGNVIATSEIGHFIAGNVKGKKTNAKSLTLEATSATVSKGGVFKITAKQKKAKKGKKYKLLSKGHAPLLRYVSDTPEVATVDANGVITGVNSGTCKVYVITVNGISKSMDVTVR